MEINNKRVPFTIENIEEELKKYKKIYSKELLRYLKAMLLLEINIASDTYDKELQKYIEESLSIEKNKTNTVEQLQLIKRIVRYNLFGYAKQTLKKSGINIKIEYNEQCPKLVVYYNEILLFNSIFPRENKKEKSANFIIYQIEENETIRKNIIRRLYGEYDTIYETENPYKKETKKLSRFSPISQYDNYEQKRKEELKQLIRLIEELENRTKLTENQLEFKEKSKILCNTFKKEYGPFIKKIENIDYTGTEAKKQMLVKKSPFVSIQKITTMY